MDARDREESKIRRREETLVRRVGEALDRLKPGAAGECPDAEVIAAYAERALEPAESAQWESHFATCARCRKILRVLAASADTPLAEKEVARLGELVSAAHAQVGTPGKPARRPRPIFSDWRTRWLAPALGVAAVLAVWFAMRPPWRATGRGASATLVAQAPKEELPQSPAPTEVDQFSKEARLQDQKSEAAPPLGRPSVNAQSLDSTLEGREKGRADASTAKDKISPSTDEESNSLKKQDKELNAPPERREIQPAPNPPPPAFSSKSQAAMQAPGEPQSEAKAATGTPAPPPLPQARAKANEAAAPSPAVPPSTSQSVVVTESTPQVGTTNGTLGGTIQQTPSDLPLNGRAYDALTLRPTRDYPTLLKAPSGSILWRAGKSGVIEYSSNAGGNWISQKSPSQEDWVAGAAVSNTVCWLVGRNGAIARTLDGNRWERVSPPGQAATTGGKQADWTGITARDAQIATITASDGRKYATVNGGKTWQAQ
jgi:hypothetical protein